MPNLVLGFDDAQLKRGRDGVRVIRFVIKVGGEDDAVKIRECSERSNIENRCKSLPITSKKSL